MFYLTEAAVGLLLASSALAVPLAGPQHAHQRFHRKRQGPAAGGTFNIDVINNCAVTKSAGLFQITPDFSMISASNPVSIEPGSSATIPAPFNAIGMRLSATADQGTAAQWAGQTLFEFGYSEYAGQTGTAYDLSVMQGSQDGISVRPENSQCESKICSPLNCALGQGWTDPGQVSAGSPADTVCYFGPTNFAVTFCP